MSEINNHIERAKSNFSFLNFIENSDFYDWKVTVSFYTALHIINAHIFEKTGIHYKTHQEVEKAINPYYKMSLSKLDEDVYTAYNSLSSLSRRSRYMVHKNKTGLLTYDKHVAKSYRHLNTILSFFNKYCKNFKKITTENIEIKQNELEFFLKKSF